LQIRPGCIFNTAPNATAAFGTNAAEAGIWMGGGGLCVDSQTNLYCFTGNGTFTATNGTGRTEYGDSILRLSTTNGIHVADYFTPWEQATLAVNDTDLGSGAPMLIPDLPGTNAHLLVGGGKSGKFYLLNREQFTAGNNHYNAGGNSDAVLQTFTNLPARFMSGPAYFNGNVYFSSWNDKMKVYSISNAVLIRTPTSVGPRTFAFPGCTPVVSANGTNNGIVWSTAFGAPAVLAAWNATNVTTEIYNSAQAAANRDALTNGVKFTSPMIANGKAYVGGQFALSVFGLNDPSLHWKTFHFGTNATNTSVSGDFADPEGDSSVNLLEYALGTDPNVANSGNALSAAVVAGQCKATFNRNASAADLTYVVETSSNLASWIASLTWTSATGWSGSGGSATATETPPSSLPPDQIVTVTADLGGLSSTPLFVRLRVHR